MQPSITNKETVCHHFGPGERCELYQWLWVAAELSMNSIQPVSFLSGYRMFSSDAQFLSRFQLHLLILGGAVHSCNLDRSAFCLPEPCGNVPALGLRHTHALTNTYPGTCISQCVQLFPVPFCLAMHMLDHWRVSDTMLLLFEAEAIKGFIDLFILVF